jgi:hypothetical protein
LKVSQQEVQTALAILVSVLWGVKLVNVNPIAYTTTTTSKSASSRNFSRNFSGDVSEKKI